MGSDSFRASRHQGYVSEVPFAGIALPPNEAHPYRAPYLLPVPPPFKSQDSGTSSHRSKLARRLLLGGKILFLALLVMAMLMPVVVKLHVGFVHRAEARRVYRIRAFKHRTAFHFQPAKNWMSGEY